MDTVPLKLDGLPIEIIQCIASHGLCEAALTLSHVNRSLYKACSDRQVFKSIIKNRNGHDGPNWDIMPLSDGSPTSSWARYALADSMARRWIAKADANPPWLPVHFPSWAPQLMCSSHPVLSSVDPAMLYAAFFKALGDELHPATDNDVEEDSYTIAFCITLMLMSRRPRDSNDPTFPPNTIAWHEAHESFKVDHESAMIGFNEPHANPSEKTRMRRGAAVLAVGIISEELRRDGCTREQVITPAVTDINFHAMMDLPLPFCPYASAIMGSWHLPQMTSQRFLEDGEWIGLYSYSDDAHRPRSLDPPMRGISFTTSIDHTVPGCLFFEGVGVDSIGSFDLNGYLITETGDIKLSKTYRLGHCWYWGAFMTPFGIVGTWGYTELGGWVWLWKASWLSK